jgi:O-antigen/teichoic acid export membrane protein
VTPGQKPHALISDSLQVLIVRALSLVSSAGVGIVVARALGPAGRGVYTVPGILAALIATIFAGLSTTLASRMLQDVGPMGGVRAALASGAPMVAGGALAIGILTVFSHQLWAAPWAIAALPFMAISAIANGYFYGNKNVRLGTILGLSSTLANLTFLATGFLLLGKTPQVGIAMWLASNVLIGSCALVFILWHASKTPYVPVPVMPFFTYSLRVGGNGLISMLNYRIDLYVVAFFSTTQALGLYGTAVSAAETLLIVSQVASIVTVPQIGSLPRAEAARFVARCIRNNFVIATLCAAAAALVAPYVVEIMFGAAFLPAVPALRVLLIGMVALSASGLLSSYYTLNTKKPQVALLISGASAVACFVISIVLVPRIGIVGAAAGTAVSYLAGIVVMFLIFSRETGIPMSHIVFVQWEDLRVYRSLLLRSRESKPLGGIRTP